MEGLVAVAGAEGTALAGVEDSVGGGAVFSGDGRSRTLRRQEGQIPDSPTPTRTWQWGHSIISTFRLRVIDQDAPVNSPAALAPIWR